MLEARIGLFILSCKSRKTNLPYHRLAFDSFLKATDRFEDGGLRGGRPAKLFRNFDGGKR